MRWSQERPSVVQQRALNASVRRAVWTLTLALAVVCPAVSEAQRPAPPSAASSNAGTR